MAKAFNTKTIEHRWAAVVKNPKGYIDPCWHKTKASAVAEAARINKVHGGWFETKRVKAIRAGGK